MSDLTDLLIKLIPLLPLLAVIANGLLGSRYSHETAHRLAWGSVGLSFAFATSTGDLQSLCDALPRFRAIQFGFSKACDGTGRDGLLLPFRIV